MSLDYRLILTAWNILEIDGQTLLGVGGISSSFLGEVRSKIYSHIPMLSLQQSTELKSNSNQEIFCLNQESLKYEEQLYSTLQHPYPRQPNRS